MRVRVYESIMNKKIGQKCSWQQHKMTERQGKYKYYKLVVSISCLYQFSFKADCKDQLTNGVSKSNQSLHLQYDSLSWHSLQNHVVLP